MAVVVITRDQQTEKAITKASENIEVEPLVRGRVVAVKPNDTYASLDNCERREKDGNRI